LHRLIIFLTAVQFHERGSIMQNIYIKKNILLLIGLFFAVYLNGQTLTVNSPQLNFGTVFENNPDSIALTIYNNLGKTVNVTGIKFYDIYNNKPFSCSHTVFSIPDGGSQQIYIKFSPLHNIFHNTEMVVQNDAMRGGIAVDLTGQGRYSLSYYDSTENYSEELLKTHIHDLTGINYNALTYNPARDSMFMSLDNKKVNGQGASVNTIECVYTGREAVGYVDRADCQNNYSFNTEHTFPQNFFSSLEPMKSDLHHLFPTDDLANNTRASYPFGTVTTATWQQGGSKFDNNTNIFEPRDDHKGAAARAMFYFVLRYQNYSAFLNSQESILRTWNINFPPASVEITRNNTIHQYQNNRNPFIDYPQFTERITSLSGISTAPVDYSMEQFNSVIDYGSADAGVQHIYSYVIVNYGNQAIQLNNFNVSNSTILSLINGNNVSLLPGESFTLKLSLQSSTLGPVNEMLTYNTTDPLHATVQVPVTANIVIAGIDQTIAGKMNISPMPFSDCFEIKFPESFHATEISLTSMSGIKYIPEFINGHYCAFEISDGIYILQVSYKGGSMYRSLVVKAAN
jgi:hypothetical protein